MLVAISVVTLAAWFVPVDYRAFGDIYLLTVIALCLRVGRWPILFASFLSALAWNYVIMPPRMSFSRLDLKDGVFLGMYFVVALIAGQLTARIREQQRKEQQREKRATALFHLTRALSAAQTLDEAVEAALGQAHAHFGVQAALLMKGQGGALTLHSASGFTPDHAEVEAARELCEMTVAGSDAPLRQARRMPAALLVRIARGRTGFGVFALRIPAPVFVPPEQRELMEAFAAQIGLLMEREQLRAAAEREKLLAESDRLHRTLLDSVSHEFKTPVAVLRSAAESIVHAEEGRREALAHEIRTAGRRLDHLVANLLNQTRLEAGRVKPKLDWCDVRDLIGAGRRAVGDALKGRPFKVEVPEDMPLFMADAMLMEHVLANLLLNAVHHTPAGTAIAVRAGNEPKASRVFIAVCDRGPGIPASKRAMLFQKFERGDRARSGGLGLGLSIVRGFMLAHGGDVVVDENPGGGARFTLFLPHQLHATVPPE